MILRFIYCPPEEVKRVVQAVAIDSRATSMPLGVNGNEVQPIVDALVLQLLAPDVIVYRIEGADNGNLGGYFSLKVNVPQRTVMPYLEQLRPAYVQFSAQISGQLGTFVSNGQWKPDYLFGT